MTDAPRLGEWEHVGWTRRDWERLADRTLAAVRPYATPDKSLIHLPGPQSRSGRRSDGLEGFARTFLLAGFRLARSGGQDPDGLAQWYAAGLAAGTEPDAPGRWPEIGTTGQAKVECASVAIALHESRPWIWDRLDERVRGNIVRWMSAMVGTQTPDNNWTWFRAVTEAFLRSVGGPWRQEDIDDTIARTEAWYVGDGWYTDGVTAAGEPRCFDYYSGWAMHFYPLWYCRISGGAAEPGLLDRYRARLRRYLEDAQLLLGVDAEGVRPLIHGRSLTYRFAMLAPFWAGVVFDATPLSAGRTRRLAGGVFDHFLSCGAYDEDGLLPIGWHRAFEPMREPYSGAGSPYWASKGFAGLVLPEDHPVWSAAPEPLPIETGDVSLTLPKLGWVVSGTRADGVVRVAQHGPDHAATDRFGIDVPGYARHGYSTHTAPDYALSIPLGSHVNLLTEDRQVSHRTPVLPVAAGEGFAVSRHRTHWWLGLGPVPNDPHQHAQQADQRFEAGPWMTTASALHGPWEVRLARVEAAGPAVNGEHEQHPGPWKLAFGGWALAAGREDEIKASIEDPCVWAARADGLSTTLVELRGEFAPRCAMLRGKNPLGEYSAVPHLEGIEAVEFGRVYAVLVVLSGVLAGPGAGHGVTLTVRHETDVRVEWPDGRFTALSLPMPPNG